MFILPWLVLLTVVPIAWIGTLREFVPPLLVLAYGIAAHNGHLDPIALIPATFLLVAAYTVTRTRGFWPAAGHLLFILVAGGLVTHAFPGFHNPMPVGPERITEDALPFRMYLNYDSLLVGIWLLLVCPWVIARGDRIISLLIGFATLVGTIGVCLGVALVSDAVDWEPKLPDFTWIWVLNNLVFVTVTEEALYRGYVQGGLTKCLAGCRHGRTVALVVATAQLARRPASGGFAWLALAGVAGVGYGLAYRYGGLRASVLAHFGLSAVHFFFFTYPMLDPER
jgi:membrane protease YdiL (CAAX protease family)